MSSLHAENGGYQTSAGCSQCERRDERRRADLKMLVLGLTALRSRAAGRPAVRMDQGVTAPDDDDADLLKRMAQQRLLGKTETLAMLRLLRHL